ncbi:MAG: C39 family peptidase [Cyanobacteria bacterium HKST-UBA04]|nr:C39 family peptidase [Cyanobacteria bacterium HKST-UBA04]
MAQLTPTMNPAVYGQGYGQTQTTTNNYLAETSYQLSQTRSALNELSGSQQDYYKQSMNQLSQRVTEIREQYQQRQRRRGKPDEEEGRSNKPEEPSQQAAAQQQQDSDASGGEAYEQLLMHLINSVKDLRHEIRQLSSAYQSGQPKRRRGQNQGQDQGQGTAGGNPAVMNANNALAAVPVRHGQRVGGPKMGGAGSVLPFPPQSAAEKNGTQNTAKTHAGGGSGGGKIEMEEGEDAASFIQRVEQETGGQATGIAKQNPEKIDKLDHQQGDEQQANGTCGLVSTANVLKLAGKEEVTEKQIVEEAMSQGLCTDSADPNQSGGSSPQGWEQLMNNHGVSASSKQASMDEVGKDAKEGKGVVMAVNAETLWGEGGGSGPSGGGDGLNHAITLTGTIEKGGQTLGYIVTDSASGKKAQFVPKDLMEQATGGQTEATVTNDSLTA